MTNTREIHIVSSFHYDVAYLETFHSYLGRCFANLDEAMRILATEPQYKYTIEQVILIEEFCRNRPDRLAALRKFAGEGRLEVAPGMYVMPDMNHPGGEAMFVQARIGRDWLAENLGLEPRVCWIADPWGHHAQLPQILAQAGYQYYAFWRCMRPDVHRNNFNWRGLDSTMIRTHWLTSYAGLGFPTTRPGLNLADLETLGCGVADVRKAIDQLEPYGQSAATMLCNGGDFIFPQASGPEVVRQLSASGQLPPIQFSTPAQCLDHVDWPSEPTFDGEFNSALQGTFTSNIRIKQLSRTLTNRLLAMETLAVVVNRPRELTEIWKLLLKQQFHDIICGTLCDAALADSLQEFELACEQMDQAQRELLPDATAPQRRGWFNPLSFERAEVIEADGRQLRVNLPPTGFASQADATDIGPASAMAGTSPVSEFPATFENEWYRATIGAGGYITSLVEKSAERELVAPRPALFGSLALQMDYGDLWLNFDAPLSGGSEASFHVQNHRDPYDRSRPEDIANHGTFAPWNVRARVLARTADMLCVEQTGVIGFWDFEFEARTLVRFTRQVPRIEYRTTFVPKGKHYRVRVVFPTSIAGGTIRHEIPFGIQQRPTGEHVAQHWADYADARGGLAVLNRGTPANNVDDGVAMLTLFRSSAMEYKAPSASSFGVGVEHTFDYAIVPHGPADDVQIIREGMAFNCPPVECSLPAGGGPVLAPWHVQPDNVFISGLRHSGSKVFIRIYEGTGQPARGVLRVPKVFREAAPADGLQRPTGPFAGCDGMIRLNLRPFEIQAFLLRRAGEAPAELADRLSAPRK